MALTIVERKSKRKWTSWKSATTTNGTNSSCLRNTIWICWNRPSTTSLLGIIPPPTLRFIPACTTRCVHTTRFEWTNQRSSYNTEHRTSAQRDMRRWRLLAFTRRFRAAWKIPRTRTPCNLTCQRVLWGASQRLRWWRFLRNPEHTFLEKIAVLRTRHPCTTSPERAFIQGTGGINGILGISTNRNAWRLSLALTTRFEPHANIIAHPNCYCWRFLLQPMKRDCVAWTAANFGIYMYMYITWHIIYIPHIYGD